MSLRISRQTNFLSVYRFEDCEAWRKEINLDAIVPSWDYKEKADLLKYYPQYYHKTDKVRLVA
jgi:hypothetical protein